MNNILLTVNETKQKILNNEQLLLAGDEKLFDQLPLGNWIGGTIPYFMTDNGGVFTREKLFVTPLPADIAQVNVKYYQLQQLEQVYADIPENGVGVIVIPAGSDTHMHFALNVQRFEGFATRPLVGWITGVKVEDIGKADAKIFNGQTGRQYTDGAVVLHFTFPPDRYAEINIINIFEPGDGDSITFQQDTFELQKAHINGELTDFAAYIRDKNLDTRLPLVANYNGAMINTSFQQVDTDNNRVSFYAPVLQGVEYKHARPIDDYVKQFISRVPDDDMRSILFSCNCILNYLYSELEGKKTGSITGPITFGEIAYQLVNQTLVYLSVADL